LRDSRAATQDASRERTRVTSNIVVLLFELFSAVVDAEICVQGCRLLRIVTLMAHLVLIDDLLQE
jgi:hypothetical protein